MSAAGHQLAARLVTGTPLQAVRKGPLSSIGAHQMVAALGQMELGLVGSGTRDRLPGRASAPGWGLLPVTCPAAPTTPSLLSPCPYRDPERIPWSKAALPHGGTQAESPATETTHGCVITPGMVWWPSQPAGEEYCGSSASGLG